MFESVESRLFTPWMLNWAMTSQMTSCGGAIGATKLDCADDGVHQGCPR